MPSWRASSAGWGTTLLRSSLTDVRDDAAALLIHTVAIDDLGGLSDSPREEYLLLRVARVTFDHVVSPSPPLALERVGVFRRSGRAVWAFRACLPTAFSC